MARITIDNVNIYYEWHLCQQRNPEGTLILIHGFLSSCFSFRRLIPLLTKRYTVAAIDLPGFGDSEKSRTFMYSLENYGKLIVSFMDQTDLQNAVLVGHSMGGQIALHAAKQASGHIKKLILLASSGYLKPFSRRLVYLSYLPFFTSYVRKAFERRDAAEVIREVVHDPNIIDENMTDGYVRPFREKAIYGSLIRLLRHHGGDLTDVELQAIHTPSLLIWGLQDRIVPVATGKRLADDLPNAVLKIYEHTGHLIPEEKPQEVFHDIQAFLKS